MKPRYFRTSYRPLFGIYHPPKGGTPRHCGIVLCYPMGQEYVRAHRSFRQLAIRLAKSGFPVIRFDYYGCGDSSGESADGEIDQWMSDITSAIEEVKLASGLEKVVLVGARLGATLSFLVGSRRCDVENLVLWEPIVRTGEYIQELIARDESWSQDAIPKPAQVPDNNGDRELLGFPLSQRLRSGLELINPLTIEQCQADELYIIESHHHAGSVALREHLNTLHVRCAYRYEPGPTVWFKEPGISKTLVPTRLLESIVSWISMVSV